MICKSLILLNVALEVRAESGTLYQYSKHQSSTQYTTIEIPIFRSRYRRGGVHLDYASFRQRTGFPVTDHQMVQ